MRRRSDSKSHSTATQLFGSNQLSPESQHPPVLLTTPVLQQMSEELLADALPLAAVAVLLHKPVEMPQLGPAKPGWHWQAEVAALQTPLLEQSAVELHVKVSHKREERGVYPSWVVHTCKLQC